LEHVGLVLLTKLPVFWIYVVNVPVGLQRLQMLCLISLDPVIGIGNLLENRFNSRVENFLTPGIKCLPVKS
jgi:hypothetical protein